jgi:hypothetical protein
MYEITCILSEFIFIFFHNGGFLGLEMRCVVRWLTALAALRELTARELRHVSFYVAS